MNPAEHLSLPAKPRNQEESGVRRLPVEEKDRKVLLRAYKDTLRDWNIGQEQLKSLDREYNKLKFYINARNQGATPGQLESLNYKYGMDEKYRLNEYTDQEIMKDHQRELTIRTRQMQKDEEKLRVLEHKLGLPLEEIEQYRQRKTGEIINFPVSLGDTSAADLPTPANQIPLSDQDQTVPAKKLSGMG